MRARSLLLFAVATLSVGTGLVAGDASSSVIARPAPRVASAPFAPNQQLLYFGGRVIAHPKIYEVSWGPNVSSTLTTGLPAFYTAITNSAYLDWLSEYDTIGVRAVDGSMGTSQRIGRGTFGGAFVITPSYVSNTIDDNVIQAELAAQLDAGELPQPDGDSMYMIDFPPAVTIYLYNAGQLASSCTGGFGAYHMAMIYKGQAVVYGVHPDCGANLAGATYVHSHEMIEAITDPEIGMVDPDDPKGETRPSAWYSFINGVDSGEAADLCEQMPGVTVAGYDVSQIWSNTAGACIGTDATIICDGSSPPIPGCRPCTAADDGAACNGERSHCETNAASFKAGQCVVCTTSTQCTAPNSTCKSAADDTDDTCIDTAACSSNAGCSGTTPFCDATTHACRGCVASDCSGATPACETFQPNVNFGRCVQCTGADATACTATTPVCDVYTNVCKGCVTNADCHGNAPICDVPTSHTCRACTSNTDCTGGGTCVTTPGDPNAGRCVACTTNTQCTAPATCGPNNICVLTSGGADAGAGDAGVTGTDAGTDGAVIADAGEDAPPGVDASAPADAGLDALEPPVDAAMAMDAARPHDGAVRPAEDAAGGSEAGASGGSSDESGGCDVGFARTSPAGAGVLLLLAAALGRRRRRVA